MTGGCVTVCVLLLASVAGTGGLPDEQKYTTRSDLQLCGYINTVPTLAQVLHFVAGYE